MPLNYVLERAVKFGNIKMYTIPVWMITGHLIKHQDSNFEVNETEFDQMQMSFTPSEVDVLI